MHTASHREGFGLSANPDAPNSRRRRFLLTLGLTGAGAAATAAVPLATAAVGNAAENASSASGYRETEHVRDYYDSARI